MRKTVECVASTPAREISRENFHQMKHETLCVPKKHNYWDHPPYKSPKVRALSHDNKVTHCSSFSRSRELQDVVQKMCGFSRQPLFLPQDYQPTLRSLRHRIYWTDQQTTPILMTIWRLDGSCSILHSSTTAKRGTIIKTNPRPELFSTQGPKPEQYEDFLSAITEECSLHGYKHLLNHTERLKQNAL